MILLYSLLPQGHELFCFVQCYHNILANGLKTNLLGHSDQYAVVQR